MEKTIITIPKPCSQDWNTMSPQEQGRFCSSCEKMVVDFTNKTPLQIKETLMQSTGKVCGRFKKSDLGRPLEEEPVIRPVWVPVRTSWIKSKWTRAAAVFFAFFVGKKSNAQMLGQVVLKLPDDTTKRKDCAVAPKPTATIIHGQIRSIYESKGLSRVSIKVYSNEKEIAHTFVFKTGYALTLPANTIFDFKITVEVSAVGFETKVIRDIPSVKDKIAMDILMEPVKTVELPLQHPEQPTNAYYLLGEPAMDHVEVHEEILLGNVTMNIPEVQKQEDTAQYEQAKENVNKEQDKHKRTVPKVLVSLGTGFAIKAYPNPGNGLFNLDLKGITQEGQQVDVFVHNSQGQLVYSKRQVLDQQVIDISNLPNGVYMITAVQQDTGQTAQTRVVKTG